jgi:hypothetical protein
VLPPSSPSCRCCGTDSCVGDFPALPPSQLVPAANFTRSLGLFAPASEVVAPPSGSLYCARRSCSYLRAQRMCQLPSVCVLACNHADCPCYVSALLLTMAALQSLVWHQMKQKDALC